MLVAKTTFLAPGGVGTKIFACRREKLPIVLLALIAVYFREVKKFTMEIQVTKGVHVNNTQIQWQCIESC